MPKPPPRDAAGAVEPHDHEEIEGEDGVIRRISERQLIIDKTGIRRISTIAYQSSGGLNGGMSVDLERFIINDGVDPKAWVTTPRWVGSVKFRTGFLRELGFKVGYDPIEESDGVTANPYHGEVWGGFTRDQKTSLRDNAQWFVPIDGVKLA